MLGIRLRAARERALQATQHADGTPRTVDREQCEAVQARLRRMAGHEAPNEAGS